ncbi:MAG TPA: hypothetical protein ENK66_01795 [Arcobacter sp.]|jgi:hypothetical protein|nr:hypothetical protein [Arcobacter sp.]
MYTVIMEQECSCFKKSGLTNNNKFNTRQEANNFAKMVAEIMNEDFCSKHTFYAQRAEDDMYVIRVTIGEAPIIGTSCSTPATDDWEKYMQKD